MDTKALEKFVKNHRPGCYYNLPHNAWCSCGSEQATKELEMNKANIESFMQLQAENKKLCDLLAERYEEYLRICAQLAAAQEHIEQLQRSMNDTVHRLVDTELRLSSAQADVEKALHEAVNILWLDDNSDYRSALWTIVEILGDERIIKMLENNDGIDAWLSAHEEKK